MVDCFTEQEIFDLTTKTHRHFVDTMGERFHSTFEGYCEIKVLPILGGGFNYEPTDTVFMREIQWDEKHIIGITAHESGHCLHQHMRDVYNKEGLEAVTEDEELSWASEVVASLGAMIYLEENFWPIDVHDYLRTKYKMPDHDIAAIRAFHKGNHLLGEISVATPEQVRELIESA